MKILFFIFTFLMPLQFLYAEEATHLSPQIRFEPLVKKKQQNLLVEYRNFLDATTIVLPENLKKLSKVTLKKDRLAAVPGDYIYVDQDIKQQKYRIMRPSTLLKDSQHKKLGVLLEEIGVASPVAHHPHVFAIKSASKEVVSEDVLFPFYDAALPATSLTPPPNFEAHVLAVQGGLSLAAQYQVILLDKGKESGLAVGQMLNVYPHEGFIKDQETANILIFEVSEKSGLGLVTHSRSTIALGDIVY